MGTTKGPGGRWVKCPSFSSMHVFQNSEGREGWVESGGNEEATDLPEGKQERPELLG